MECGQGIFERLMLLMAARVEIRRSAFAAFGSILRSRKILPFGDELLRIRSMFLQIGLRKFLNRSRLAGEDNRPFLGGA